MKWVYVSNSFVHEIVPKYAIPPEQWYGAEFASQCFEAPDDVGQGWVYNYDTDEFTPPSEMEDEPKHIDKVTELQLAIAELAEIVLGGVPNG